LGIVADIHGNAVALNAVLASPEAQEIDDWWALGDLVLFGPRPVEVLETLASLPHVSYVSGNTDRYVLTGQQPRPHSTRPPPLGTSISSSLTERWREPSVGLEVRSSRPAR